MSPDLPPVVLEVEGLSAAHGDIRALWDVSLTVRRGEVTAVLGRNGAGKTTLLSAIAGLLPALSGSIRIDGTELTRRSAADRTRRGVALVQENKRVFRRRTVAENLALGGFTLPRREVRPAMEAAYERFPVLAAKRDAGAGSLSGGQQQMLAIAQALMPGPSLLMLDEPSAGLAPVIVQELLDTVRELTDTGIGILLVEQLVDKALSVARQVVLIEHGRVGSHERVGDRPDTAAIRAAYLGRETAPT